MLADGADVVVCWVPPGLLRTRRQQLSSDTEAGGRGRGGGGGGRIRGVARSVKVGSVCGSGSCGSCVISTVDLSGTNICSCMF